MSMTLKVKSYVCVCCLGLVFIVNPPPEALGGKDRSARPTVRTYKYSDRIQLHDVQPGVEVPSAREEEADKKAALRRSGPPARESTVLPVPLPPTHYRRPARDEDNKKRNWILPLGKEGEEKEASGWGWLADEVETDVKSDSGLLHDETAPGGVEALDTIEVESFLGEQPDEEASDLRMKRFEPIIGTVPGEGRFEQRTRMPNRSGAYSFPADRADEEWVVDEGFTSRFDESADLWSSDDVWNHSANRQAESTRSDTLLSEITQPLWESIGANAVLQNSMSPEVAGMLQTRSANILDPPATSTPGLPVFGSGFLTPEPLTSPTRDSTFEGSVNWGAQEPLGPERSLKPLVD